MIQQNQVLKNYKDELLQKHQLTSYVAQPLNYSIHTLLIILFVYTLYSSLKILWSWNCFWSILIVCLMVFSFGHNYWFLFAHYQRIVQDIFDFSVRHVLESFLKQI